ncbi:hypothetical protein E1176_03345 [Fulvivirga sp. RKSG066]|uniref:hypothetical protein n=1 Tax=Fulvivirga aurantia TaxID=2529383 RepID=UPI0012BC5229|nr:hypothetical protein [Fulvivirga aurantia]MTI20047.1 hypothetical protein [Fulvivirga aurantia]
MLNKQLEHFRNLVSLAMADGKLADAERVYLSKVAFSKGIPLDRMNVMLERAHEYAYLIPQNSEEKEKQLSEMIEFALVDGDFAKAERELIMTVGDRLGFSTADIEKIIGKHLVS